MKKTKNNANLFSWHKTSRGTCKRLCFEEVCEDPELVWAWRTIILVSFSYEVIIHFLWFMFIFNNVHKIYYRLNRLKPICKAGFYDVYVIQRLRFSLDLMCTLGCTILNGRKLSRAFSRFYMIITWIGIARLPNS